MNKGQQSRFTLSRAMTTDGSLGALASLAKLALQRVTAEEILEELTPFFQKKPGVVKIFDHAPAGSLGRFCSQVCLLPGKHFELGKRVSVEVLPAPRGLEWTCWAVEATEEPEGWSHVERAGERRPSFKPVQHMRKEHDKPRWTGRPQGKW